MLYLDTILAYEVRYPAQVGMHERIPQKKISGPVTSSLPDLILLPV